MKDCIISLFPIGVYSEFQVSSFLLSNTPYSIMLPQVCAEGIKKIFGGKKLYFNDKELLFYVIKAGTKQAFIKEIAQPHIVESITQERVVLWVIAQEMIIYDIYCVLKYFFPPESFYVHTPNANDKLFIIEQLDQPNGKQRCRLIPVPFANVIGRN